MVTKPATIWDISECGERAAKLAATLDIENAIAQVLINRGITEYEAAKSFLYPSLESLHDPFSLADMDIAVDRIDRALAQEEKIVVYGDYDADGVTSTALLFLVLRGLGAIVEYYIPDRIEEGYGLNPNAIRNLAQSFSLMITVDCGVTACREVELARSLGLDVIITDHHLPKIDIPEALAVVNPKQKNCEYPFEHLAGVGVAFKLAHALLIRKYGERKAFETIREYLDIAAIGTVADVVPLVGENRAIVKYGLEMLNNSRKPGIKALLTVCRLGDKAVGAGHVGFVLAPRINAAGRVGTADVAVRLLTTDAYEEAIDCATFLDAENSKRKLIEENIERQALSMLDDINMEDKHTIVLASEGWHHGVIGIVASRLVERFHKPTILLASDGDELKGSARSIPAVDMFDVLSEHKSILNAYGGHALAAGLSLHKKDLSVFEQAFDASVKSCTEEKDFHRRIHVDASLSLQDATLSLADRLELLAPFGVGNPRPVFATESVSIENSRTLSDGKHLKLDLSQHGVTRSLISWRDGHRLGEFKADQMVSVAYNCEVNEWKGKRSITLIGKDIIAHRPQLIDCRTVFDKEEYVSTLVGADRKVVVVSFAYEVLKGIRFSGIADVKLAEPVMLYFSNNTVSVIKDINEIEVTDIVIYDFPYHHKQVATLIKGKKDISVHVLFNEADRNLLLNLVNKVNIDRSLVEWIYRQAKQCRVGNTSVLHWKKMDTISELEPELVRPVILAGINILQELGICTLQSDANQVMIYWKEETSRKVSLSDSRLFRFYQSMPSRVKRESSKLIGITASELEKLLV